MSTPSAGSAASVAAPAPSGEFRWRYVRIEEPGDVPAPEPDTLDVAILDMNHGWPNLGHGSLVHEVENAAAEMCAVQPGLRVRALSFEVRRKAMIPEPPGGRFALYLGTGGPGHLDPRRNDGLSDESQGVAEDPAWEAPLFELFDAVLADAAGDDTALLAVCHTFGVICRWARIARPVLRGPEKGGKSSGILENVLTAEGESHPWFGHLAERLRRGRLRITDTRLFDLLPEPELGARALPIGYETLGVGGPPGDALTMVELARDRGGLMPRIFAVNHHPEVVERAAQLKVLQRMVDAGEVTEAWATERRKLMTAHLADEDSDRMLRLTADYTLLQPLRFHLFRQARRRAEALGLPVAIHEDMVAASAAQLPAASMESALAGGAA
jgi:hypothetical protein